MRYANILALIFAAIAFGDEGSIKEQTVIIVPGGAIQNLRSSSTSVQQIQWCLTGATCDVSAVGGWTMGPDGSNNFVVNAGVGGSVLNIFQLTAGGNLSVPGRLSAGNGLFSGSLTSGTSATFNGTVTFNTLFPTTGAQLCVASGVLGTCTGTGILGTLTPGKIPLATGSGTLGDSDLSDSAGNVSTGGTFTANGIIGTASGYDVNGSPVIDSVRAITASSVTSSGGMSATGNITAGASGAGYVKSNNGYYEGSTPFLDTSLDLTNIANFSNSGTVTFGGLASSVSTILCVGMGGTVSVGTCAGGVVASGKIAWIDQYGAVCNGTDQFSAFVAALQSGAHQIGIPDRCKVVLPPTSWTYTVASTTYAVPGSTLPGGMTSACVSSLGAMAAGNVFTAPYQTATNAYTAVGCGNGIVYVGENVATSTIQTSNSLSSSVVGLPALTDLNYEPLVRTINLNLPQWGCTYQISTTVNVSGSTVAFVAGAPLSLYRPGDSVSIGSSQYIVGSVSGSTLYLTTSAGSSSGARLSAAESGADCPMGDVQNVDSDSIHTLSTNGNEAYHVMGLTARDHANFHMDCMNTGDCQYIGENGPGAALRIGTNNQEPFCDSQTTPYNGPNTCVGPGGTTFAGPYGAYGVFVQRYDNGSAYYIQDDNQQHAYGYPGPTQGYGFYYYTPTRTTGDMMYLVQRTSNYSSGNVIEMEMGQVCSGSCGGGTFGGNFIYATNGGSLEFQVNNGGALFNAGSTTTNGNTSIGGTVFASGGWAGDLSASGVVKTAAAFQVTNWHSGGTTNNVIDSTGFGTLLAGNTALYWNVGTTLTANGIITSAAGFNIGSSPVIDASLNGTFQAITATGGASITGNISTSGGYVKSNNGYYIGSVPVWDAFQNQTVNGTATFNSLATFNSNISIPSLPTSAGTALCESATHLMVLCSSPGGVTGSSSGTSGANYYLPMWNASTNLIDSPIYQYAGALFTSVSFSAGYLSSTGNISATGNVIAGAGSSGFVRSSGGYYAGTTQIIDPSGVFLGSGNPGVTCGGVTPATVIVINGIVTHC